MPYKSRAQQGYMHAAAERGEIDPKVVEEFDEASKGQHDLPRRVGKKRRMSKSLEGPLLLVAVVPPVVLMVKAIHKRDDARKSAPKGYPRSRKEYADPTNLRYPLDTEEHVRAAWDYIHHPDNAGKYSAEELKAMRAHMRRAGKHFGIAFSAD